MPSTWKLSLLSLQESENEKLNQERLQLIEENRGLLNRNQKLAEESSYAKELASAAAVELKNLAEEVTKLSVENARQANELLIAQEMAYSRGGSGGLRKIEAAKLGRRSRSVSRGGEFATTAHDDVECFNAELVDMKIELQARRQREAVLEATLSEKELLEEEYRKKFDEAKKREVALENDLAGMWVLVAKLKKGGSEISELSIDDRPVNRKELINVHKENKNDCNGMLVKERPVSNGLIKPNGEQLNRSPELEPLLNRLKVNYILILMFSRNYHFYSLRLDIVDHVYLPPLFLL